MKRNLQSTQLNQKFQHNFTSGRSILVVIQVLTVRMTSPDLKYPIFIYNSKEGRHQAGDDLRPLFQAILFPATLLMTSSRP